ncbi:outer membrane beta-barrel protein [Flavihumibacter profundi]|jgi:hypothetical protein|uniref:outer membrane beta-barrel protein n=1 Tax=Flavihumibacter profundi TaxID=2716883 RepID=UPI001CC7A468|nr:outer membrane beta-barrel protein [Flavihumibacter profundi]MBZ5859021.1 outer membrane beta-barrel protein [Flavihumibacter profundi]
MRKIILMTICVLGSGFMLAGYAQKVGEFSYQASFPTGKFGDFIGKTSWVGFSGGGRGYLKSNEQLSIGGSLSWFYMADKKGKQTFTGPEGGVTTGNLTNFTNIYGLMAVIQYDLKKRNEKKVPYIRGGLGGAYQNQNSDIGIYRIQNDGFQFMMNAEAGVNFNMSANNGIVLAATYHYLPEASGMVTTSFFGIKLAVTSFSY